MSGERIDEAEREAHETVWANHPSQELVNEEVYRQAYLARAERGVEYASAYAREVGLGNFDTAAEFAEAFVKMLRAGKSELFANYYAGEVSGDTAPRYAELEAEIYEQALADGMADEWARKYAERLATNLIKYAKTDEDKNYYTQEAAEYIAKAQQKP